MRNQMLRRSAGSFAQPGLSPQDQADPWYQSMLSAAVGLPQFMAQSPVGQGMQNGQVPNAFPSPHGSDLEAFAGGAVPIAAVSGAGAAGLDAALARGAIGGPFAAPWALGAAALGAWDGLSNVGNHRSNLDAFANQYGPGNEVPTSVGPNGPQWR